jgi:integrase
VIALSLKHLISDKDRKGNVRFYVRVAGAKKKRIRGEPGSQEFIQDYTRAVASALTEAGRRSRREESGTVGWLVERYLKSGDFADLDKGTQDRRRRMLTEFSEAYGDRRAERPRKFVVTAMDKWKAAHGPHGANNRLKALRGMYGWAVHQELVDRDSTREVKPFSPPSEGWHTWTTAEIRKFMAHWPLGSAPRVAMTVMLCTGTRISDAYRIGPQHLRQQHKEQRIVFRPGKTEDTSGIEVSIPVLPMLAEALAAGPTSDQAFVVAKRGKAFSSPEALGNSFKRWCVEAGLSHCSAHGLRKGGATLLAESGVTSSQLMAIYGWTKMEMAERYTRKADRSRLGSALSGGFGLEEERGDE